MKSELSAERKVPPEMARWPFILSDLLLLAAAGLILYYSEWPLGLAPSVVAGACVAIGAWLCVTPFVASHKAAMRFAEADKLASVVNQIEKLDEIKKLIHSATDNWTLIQDRSQEAIKAADSMRDRMTNETKEFFAFLEKADHKEKAILKVEVEKLRRTEMAWLQLLVGVMDHAFSLTRASNGEGVGPETVVEFERTCREAGRRIGLSPILPVVGQEFDPKQHHEHDAPEGGTEGGLVAEVLAGGFNFQGQQLRKALVRVARDRAGENQGNGETEAAPESPDQNEPDAAIDGELTEEASAGEGSDREESEKAAAQSGKEDATQGSLEL